MYDVERFKRIFASYKYFMRTTELSREKIFHEYIKQLMDDGYVEKIRTGYYHWKEGNSLNEVELLSYMFPDGILSFESAMYYYGYIDEEPEYWALTFPQNSTKSRFEFKYPPVKPYFVTRDKIDIGVIDTDWEGKKVRITSRDRLMIDALRTRNKMNRSLFSKVLKGYVNDPYKDISKMLEYAESFRMVKIAMESVMIWL